MSLQEVASLPESSPLAAPSTAARPIPGGCVLPALASGLLLYACYFPLACGWLAWVALVPLLSLVRSRASGRRVFLAAWLGGAAFFVPAISWMRLADTRLFVTWMMLALYCALYLPLAVLLLRRLDRGTRLPLVLTVPVVWVALEHLRSHLATGFGWYLLGHSQHDWLRVAQVADLGGVYAVSFVLAAVNALVFSLLARLAGVRAWLNLREPGENGLLIPWPSLPAQAVLVTLLVAGTLVYGAWHLARESYDPGPRLALVQGNLDLRLKNKAWSDEPDAANASEAMRAHHIRLTDVAAAHKPDLVVWPETAWPDEWIELTDDRGDNPVPSPPSQAFAQGAIERWRLPILLGMNSALVSPDDRVRRYNSAVLVDAGGRYGGRYDKVHCVPFGEYLPFKETLPFLAALSPYDFDYSVLPGQSMTRFALGPYRFGALICYEDTVSYLAPRYVAAAGGPPVDFLVNTSNDGWFDGSAEHEEHLAVCRFRAIETRRAVARAVNMGVSAVVDPAGRVLAPRLLEESGTLRVWEVPAGSTEQLPTGRWREFKKVAGVLLANMPLSRQESFYARRGDWLPWACWAVLAAALVLAWARRRAERPAARAARAG